MLKQVRARSPDSPNSAPASKPTRGALVESRAVSKTVCWRVKRLSARQNPHAEAGSLDAVIGIRGRFVGRQ